MEPSKKIIVSIVGVSLPQKTTLALGNTALAHCSFFGIIYDDNIDLHPFDLMDLVRISSKGAAVLNLVKVLRC